MLGGVSKEKYEELKIMLNKKDEELEKVTTEMENEMRKLREEKDHEELQKLREKMEETIGKKDNELQKMKKQKDEEMRLKPTTKWVSREKYEEVKRIVREQDEELEKLRKEMEEELQKLRDEKEWEIQKLKDEMYDACFCPLVARCERLNWGTSPGASKWESRVVFSASSSSKRSRLCEDPPSMEEAKGPAADVSRWADELDEDKEVDGLAEESGSSRWREAVSGGSEGPVGETASGNEG
ncbi:unnamed protein product, partial [Linum tenue]